ncbi:MAG: heavy metal translocating P-type ATPase [Clostridia bacterium]|nr:heavy metal translocating P-type ATPase [Clostridia bacterium]
MKCKILHESAGRLRIHAMQSRMTLEQADILEYYLRNIDGVTDVKVFDHTCDAIIRYTPGASARTRVIGALSRFSYADEKNAALVPEHTGRALNRQYEENLVASVVWRIVGKLFLPAPVRTVYVICRAVKHIRQGLNTLLKGKIEVSVLDAVAITVSLLRRDFDTASSVMFLLNLGELLEEWTHKKSVDDLAGTMALQVDKTWLRTPEGQELLVPVRDVKVNDTIVVRTGGSIPLDGKVCGGDASVNQASITGEGLPVHKESGSYVYAGTVVEDGECVICVDKAMGSGRYDRIVRMIEESEKLKSTSEAKAAHLADRLVPITLGGTVLTWLLTRNVTKALSILMVDFSCALKLAMPLAILSAMRESGVHHISVKGGRFLEAVAEADTIVFDKTGTLTHAMPTVAEIIPFGDREEDEVLRLAACLEEHYPHSIARAVVAEATRRELHHEERHSKVEYVVAHGISSVVDGERVLIGSYHFIFEDEGCKIPEAERERFESLPAEYSHLYLAISGELAAVLCISDPLREEAPEVIRQLKQLGFGKIVMMTGDNAKTAASVAKTVGVDEYYAEVLPEDKANFIRREHKAGRRVIMLGDGINDSPALSEADAGIAIRDGAAIAREIADITLAADDLWALVTLRRISTALMKRVSVNYRFIISFNLMLILLGVGGILPPATSALLHNLSTLGVSMHSMTNLLHD